MSDYSIYSTTVDPEYYRTYMMTRVLSVKQGFSQLAEAVHLIGWELIQP